MDKKNVRTGWGEEKEIKILCIVLATASLVQYSAC